MKRISLVIISLLISLPSQALVYSLPEDGSRLVGHNETYIVPNGKLPLEAIADKFQLGLTNIMQANPGVDPFLPRPGTQLTIPHQLILPDAPHKGIIINLAEMRLYYYPKGDKTVEVYPIGIGEVGRDTPENWVTRVYRKKENPTWTPTAQTKADHAAKGDILPDVWPAGPDNPMGLFALYIGNLYAIHGTNASFGIGLRVSHGCVRLRNNDIEEVFKKVPIGTRVQFINNPVKVAVTPDGHRFIEVHEPLSKSIEDYESNDVLPLEFTQKVKRFLANSETDSSLLKQVLEQRSGMPVRVDE
ncbi:LysM peptidoglycan-binding domain-containing protein [Parashewanella spongiae]|uniref:LysM peptidoglycan-binding domain-containing protein n=1 Tax=Parashewanella spongiae TaxID=342950 RepID=A0A3A6U314_9GAMM|nr:L,D-transpeptidase family protein [Parashewanella spongiae]MCL1078860.1 L,D-transpeptidase family protein [Parashewanella spongiae]RJY11836.1 LysM peptidoglycan-binding domain-containing protein [Parashewanella spongiae]